MLVHYLFKLDQLDVLNIMTLNCICRPPVLYAAPAQADYRRYVKEIANSVSADIE